MAILNVKQKHPLHFNAPFFIFFSFDMIKKSIVLNIDDVNYNTNNVEIFKKIYETGKGGRRYYGREIMT